MVSSLCKPFGVESAWVNFSYEIGRGAAIFALLLSACIVGKDAAAADAYFIGNGAAGGSGADFTTGAAVPGFGGRGAILGGALCFISSFLEDIELVNEVSLDFEWEVAYKMSKY